MAIHYNWPREWISQLPLIAKSPELQALDLKKCRDYGWDSLTYWLSYHVVTQDEHDQDHPFGPLPFLYKPYMWEVAWLWYNERKLFLKKSRQMMVTWLILGCELWNVQFHKGKRTAIQSKKEDDADNLLQRMWTIYEHQPVWLQQNGADQVFCELRFPAMKSVIMGIAQGPHQLRQYTYSRIFCVGPATRVLTSNLRHIKAETIKVGDSLAGFDEEISPNRRNWRETIVLNVKKVTLPSYRLTFEDGTVIVCSGEHRWLVGTTETDGRHHAGRKWLPTNKMRAWRGKHKTKVCRLTDLWEYDTDYVAGYLAGAFDGEGNLRQAKNKIGIQATQFDITFSQNENIMLEEVIRCLKLKGFPFTQTVNNKGYSRLHHHVTISGKYETLRFLGQIRPKRLLDKFRIEKSGTIGPMRSAVLVKKEFIGEIELIGITTSTGTFVAEGLCSHNSDELGFQDSAKDAYGASKPTVDGGGYYTAVSSAIPGFFDDMWEDNVDVMENELPLEAQKAEPEADPYEGFMIPTRRNRTGILAAGFLHYSMDPDKDPSTPQGALWVAEAKKGDTKGNWNQEMEGDSGALAGQKVYPTWNEDVHLIEPREIPDHWTRYHAVDPGLANPCAMIWIAVDPNNNLYVYREHYKKELSIPQHASIIRGLEGRERIDCRILGHEAFARRAEDKRCQHDTWNDNGFFFRPASRDRTSGINLVKECLRYIPELGKVSGNPRLRVFNTCVNFRWEIGKWKYKQQTAQIENKRNPAEDPEQKDDHLMDALRMVVQEKPIYMHRQPICEVELIRG